MRVMLPGGAGNRATYCPLTVLSAPADEVGGGGGYVENNRTVFKELRSPLPLAPSPPSPLPSNTSNLIITQRVSQHRFPKRMLSAERKASFASVAVAADVRQTLRQVRSYKIGRPQDQRSGG